ncbi:hypothetical protein SADUNF_Sadunf11G0026300 [Salix dunnii]|uniref:DUF707 domain-containing protein n=1 Tax=Salix dunnii TaxID=1413687 RepID=A0A835MWN2_9ROSI|nr:hypothetical protein SADUNF_Sadunf11G0026300 [Salix dunnii]
MTSFRSWKLLKRNYFDGVKFRLKMKQLPFMGFLFTTMLFIVYRTTTYQYKHTEMEEISHPFDSLKVISELPVKNLIAVTVLCSSLSEDASGALTQDSALASGLLSGLPHGIIQASADLELKPLWSTSSSRSKADPSACRVLLAIPVGIKQKDNVNHIVQKFLPENFTVILFHYDGKVDGWWDLDWSNEVIHIAAKNQTKWWFAKRFLHPAVVSVYDYIFLWDEDLGVEHFNPGRYLKIVRYEGLEISQPALDPNSTEIHHRITIRARTKKFHRRVYERRGSTKCSDVSEGPPCTGFVEGMAPVFSRSAWYCAWHLIQDSGLCLLSAKQIDFGGNKYSTGRRYDHMVKLYSTRISMIAKVHSWLKVDIMKLVFNFQNDLVHGWGMDMKLGYCAQGDRTKKVGVVDSEYIVHKGIQTLGGHGPPGRKASNTEELAKKHSATGMDPRMEIRRQSTWELQIFKDRWNQAVKEDKKWVDPFHSNRKHRKLRLHNLRHNR